MKRFVLILFLVVPFLTAGPLETAFSREGYKSKTDLYGCNIIQFLNDEDRIPVMLVPDQDREEKEEEILVESFQFLKTTVSIFHPVNLITTLPAELAGNTDRKAGNTPPSNKSPPA